ncbi:hypothetical protein V1478_016778 [Vespula squamosa]|uniref:Uncharacterized protein n=1 Tax=Vespula squamosa TaxID=30214 RepID=A0ABD2A0T0_VESSQ
MFTLRLVPLQYHARVTLGVKGGAGIHPTKQGNDDEGEWGFDGFWKDFSNDLVQGKIFFVLKCYHKGAAATATATTTATAAVAAKPPLGILLKRGLVWQKPIKSHGSLISRRPLWPFGVSRKFLRAKSLDFIAIFIDEITLSAIVIAKDKSDEEEENLICNKEEYMFRSIRNTTI